MLGCSLASTLTGEEKDTNCLTVSPDTPAQGNKSDKANTYTENSGVLCKL